VLVVRKILDGNHLVPTRVVPATARRAHSNPLGLFVAQRSRNCLVPQDGSAVI